MEVDKLEPNDPRVESLTATVRGKTYHYLLGKPKGPQTGTVVLIHGWPDLSFSWRYQVPFLLSMNLRVIVPDMLGYGRTDAPQEIEKYSFKSTGDDIAELLGQVCPGEQIILGGHDWGGSFAWRFALWHPELLKAVFSICTPYNQPLPVYVSLEQLVERLPNFRYQLRLAGPDAEREIVTPQRIRGLLSGLYGGRGPEGEIGFTVAEGPIFENLEKIENSPIVSSEDMDYYVQEYSRNGMRGPLNWYRTRKVNYEEEVALLKDGPPRIHVPSLFISATRDPALLPALSAGMDKHFDNLTRAEVDSHHWAQWGAAEDVNAHIKKFVQSVLQIGPVKSSI
ncbi:putative epoxide hydrolase protein [Phaeoacremonium minimum UCRPA7]|uniref:Putative epoxide hydrolase protein n=1 Tax=Phaeoacremonium minimum (strain UCR-PA7) TaxID=1286976 RepID=R8BTL1_PHAM7|nr:putative epoxide hydrolase protein [Phaeoacremonium minimum UCRPA7]EOO02733.1 putative epoxide hydrolase protein [Phaeoacremonium minimum UCRPA7]